MRNVTISLDDETARWARIRAAERETSVSRLVGELLRERMLADRLYDEAEERFFAIEPRPLSEAGARYPRREELYERPRLR
jgi:plasmid stability protein